TPGCPAARRRRLDPMLFTFRGATEHMQEARTHFLTLLPRIAAFEEVRFRIEMGEAAVVRMMRDGFETLAGDHDFLEVWFWLNLKVCLHGVVQLPPIRVERPIPGQECGEFLICEGTLPVPALMTGKDFNHFLGPSFARVFRSRQGADRKAGPADT